MYRFKKILFVADGTTGEKAALSKTMELAKLNKAKLAIADVIEDLSSVTYNLNTKKSVQSLQKSMVDHRKQELEKLARSAGASRKKIRPSFSVQVGKNFIEIIRMVMKNNYDLVIKAASGESNFSKILFGSLDLHLLRKCPCPVWIIKPKQKISHSHILAAVDISPEEKKSLVLNHTIMELASSLAEIEESELHVLNAWYLPEEAWLRSKQLSKYKSVNTLLRECRNLQKIHLDELMADYLTFDPNIHLIKGHPDKVIPSFVNNHSIDLLVMGTLARSGVTGFLMGNTAEKILNSVHCSVLAVKPAGFKTPVKF